MMVMAVAVIMYKNLGLSNTQIALYTGWLYLPWVIKPFWSPFVDILKTKRWWIVVMQLLIGAAMAGVAFTLSTPFYLQASLAFLWLVAFSSATHDIAADGFYMLGLDDSQQSFFVGIRSTFYRLAMIGGQGGLVAIAGYLEHKTGQVALAWSVVFGVLAVSFILFGLYHGALLPYPAEDKGGDVRTARDVLHEFVQTFVSFFSKQGIGKAVLFILIYRLAEAMLIKMASPFLLDGREVGGLGLTTQQVGFVYGTVAPVCLTIGGIVGGIVASRKGLKYWMWPMALSITLPNVAYLILAYTMPENLLWINVAVGVEQLGYGFGFTAYMLFLIYFAQGEHKTAHYSIATGLMALGMMLPGMAAGWLQELMGYQHFFIFIMVATIPTLLLIPFMKVDREFGKNQPNQQ